MLTMSQSATSEAIRSWPPSHQRQQKTKDWRYRRRRPRRINSKTSVQTTASGKRQFALILPSTSTSPISRKSTQQHDLLFKQRSSNQAHKCAAPTYQQHFRRLARSRTDRTSRAGASIRQDLPSIFWQRDFRAAGVVNDALACGRAAKRAKIVNGACRPEHHIRRGRQAMPPRRAYLPAAANVAQAAIRRRRRSNRSPRR